MKLKELKRMLNARLNAFKRSKKYNKSPRIGAFESEPDTSSKCLIGSNSEIYLGDNIEVLKTIQDNSLDGCITDGPYGLKLLGNGWDTNIPSLEFWTEVYRVLKPGAFVASFGSPKTYHLMVPNLEDAGFEIKGQIIWVYASGMPKSKNMSLMIDKQFGNPNRGHRIATASRNHPDGTFEPNGEKLPSYKAITPQAELWEGYSTFGLKPAHEPIAIAQKPISEKNIASNVLKWGNGGINVDACRIEGRFPADIILECICNEMKYEQLKVGKKLKTIIYHTDPDCPCFHLDQQSGITHQGHWPKTKISGFGSYGNGKSTYSGTGHKCEVNAGASSYFKIIYNPKANKLDKGEGLLNLFNPHPTVKPTKLMQELIRLLIPQGGKILDPFFGSGSTGKACLREGSFDFIGIEISPEYYKTSIERCLHEQEKSHKMAA